VRENPFYNIINTLSAGEPLLEYQKQPAPGVSLPFVAPCVPQCHLQLGHTSPALHFTSILVANSTARLAMTAVVVTRLGAIVLSDINHRAVGNGLGFRGTVLQNCMSLEPCLQFPYHPAGCLSVPPERVWRTHFRPRMAYHRPPPSVSDILKGVQLTNTAKRIPALREYGRRMAAKSPTIRSPSRNPELS
jgi:hypothetical protein